MDNSFFFISMNHFFFPFHFYYIVLCATKQFSPFLYIKWQKFVEEILVKWRYFFIMGELAPLEFLQNVFHYQFHTFQLLSLQNVDCFLVVSLNLKILLNSTMSKINYLTNINININNELKMVVIMRNAVFMMIK